MHKPLHKVLYIWVILQVRANVEIALKSEVVWLLAPLNPVSFTLRFTFNERQIQLYLSLCTGVNK